MKTIHKINLSLTHKRKNQELSLLSKPLTYFSVASISLFFIAYIVSFAILSYYSQKLQEYTQETETLIRRIEEKRDVEAILSTQRDKLVKIEELMKTELPYTTILTDVEGMLTGGISIQNLSVDTDKMLSADLLASSSADLVQFVDALENRPESFKFAVFSTSSISRTAEGGYTLALQFQLKKNGTVN